MTLLDAGPLLDTIARRGGLPAILAGAGRHQVNTDARAVYRARAAGVISLDVADRVCVRLLGLHPALVYGDAWWDAIDEPDEVAEAWAAGELPLVLGAAS